MSGARVVALCGVSGSGRRAARVRRLDLAVAGRRPNVRLKLTNITAAVVSGLSPRLHDLLELAAYVYAIDGQVGRGGLADVYGSLWSRDIAVKMGVRDVDFWQQQLVRTQLETVLGFLTDDTWHFEFVPSAVDEQDQEWLEFESFEPFPGASAVALFSGGADSLAGALDLHQSGQLPVLVSHRSSSVVAGRQRALHAELARCTPRWSFHHVSLWAGNPEGGASDFNQRSRSFLFLSLGAVVAGQLGIDTLHIPENGVVSINVPKLPQTVGARASRSTHPRFIHDCQAFLRLVLERALVVTNPYVFRTRAEVMTRIKECGHPELLQESVSCVHTVHRPAAYPHCGWCSQCIDRRFASVAAGLEAHDLAVRYERDIFVDDLEGEGLQHAESIVRFGRLVSGFGSFEHFFERFPMAEEPIPYLGGASSSNAQAIAALHFRYSSEILGAVAEMARRHATSIAAGKVGRRSLLALAASVP